MTTLTIARPVGDFHLRICAGCGEQINDGHHGHGGKLAPVYEIPAVPQTRLDTAEREVERLVAAIEDYLLWEPGRRGHAAAHRAHRALLDAIKSNPNQGRSGDE